MANYDRKKVLALFSGAGVLAALDYVVKVLIVQGLAPGETLGGGVMRITYVTNPGAAWSVLANVTVAITIFSVMVVSALASALWRTTSWVWGSALMFLVGGAIGNLLDRFLQPPGPFRGHVVDYIAIGNFPVFNFADICVTVGAVLMVYCIIWGVPFRKLPAVDNADESSS